MVLFQILLQKKKGYTEALFCQLLCQQIMPRCVNASACAKAKRHSSLSTFGPMNMANDSDSNNGSLYSEDESEDDGDNTQESSITALQQLYSVFLPPNLRPTMGQERMGKAVSINFFG